MILLIKKMFIAYGIINHCNECTYNGDKKELYLDVYKKEENKCIKLESEEN